MQVAARAADLQQLMQRNVVARSGQQRHDSVQVGSQMHLQSNDQSNVLASEMQLAAQASDVSQLMQRTLAARSGGEREDSAQFSSDHPDADKDIALASDMQVAAQAADVQQLLQRGVVARTAAEREQQQHSAQDANHLQVYDSFCSASAAVDEDDDADQAGEMEVAAKAVDAQQLLQRGVVARTATEREEQQRNAPDADSADSPQADRACHVGSTANIDDQDQDNNAEQAGEMQVAAKAADAQQLLQRGVVSRTAAEREEQQRKTFDSADSAQADHACHAGSTTDDDDQDEDDVAAQAGEMQVAAHAADVQGLLQHGVVARTVAEHEEQQGKSADAVLVQADHACHVGSRADSDDQDLDDDGVQAGEMQVAVQAADAQQL